MRNRVSRRLVTEQRPDEEVRPYIQQLMKTQSCSQVQTFENTNSIDIAELNNEPGPSKTSKVRGPILLKDVWNLPPGKTIVVSFNSRNSLSCTTSVSLSLSFLGCKLIKTISKRKTKQRQKFIKNLKDRNTKEKAIR